MITFLKKGFYSLAAAAFAWYLLNPIKELQKTLFIYLIVMN